MALEGWMCSWCNRPIPKKTHLRAGEGWGVCYYCSEQCRQAHKNSK